jgi:hypothetical protein
MKKFIITEEDRRTILRMYKTNVENKFLVKESTNNNYFESGKSYNYQFFDSKNNPIKTPKIKVGDKEYNSKGKLNVQMVHGYDILVNLDDFKTGAIDLQADNNTLNNDMFHHPDFTSEYVDSSYSPPIKVKVFPQVVGQHSNFTSKQKLIPVGTDPKVLRESLIDFSIQNELYNANVNILSNDTIQISYQLKGDKRYSISYIYSPIDDNNYSEIDQVLKKVKLQNNVVKTIPLRMPPSTNAKNGYLGLVILIEK